MSGGSWDYAYWKVEGLAEGLIDSHPELAGHPLRVALHSHLEQLAEVVRDIEWSDSGDTAEDAWVQPLHAFLTDHSVPFEDYPDLAELLAARERYSLVDYLRSVGVIDSDDTSSGYCRCPNPLHGSHDYQSLKYSQDEFTCWQCESSGGVMYAIEITEGITPKEAFQRFLELADAAANSGPQLHSGTGQVPADVKAAPAQRTRRCGHGKRPCRRLVAAGRVCPIHKHTPRGPSTG